MEENVNSERKMNQANWTIFNMPLQFCWTVNCLKLFLLDYYFDCVINSHELQSCDSPRWTICRSCLEPIFRVLLNTGTLLSPEATEFISVDPPGHMFMCELYYRKRENFEKSSFYYRFVTASHIECVWNMCTWGNGEIEGNIWIYFSRQKYCLCSSRTPHDYIQTYAFFIILLDHICSDL